MYWPSLSNRRQMLREMLEGTIKVTTHEGKVDSNNQKHSCLFYSLFGYQQRDMGVPHCWTFVWRIRVWLGPPHTHYNDVIMGAIASQITSLTIVYSTVYSDADQRKTSKLRITGLCVGDSPGTGEFPAQMASNAESISIWWRHHAEPGKRFHVMTSSCVQ